MHQKNLKKLIEQLHKEGYLSWIKNVYDFQPKRQNKNVDQIEIYLIGGAVRDALLGKDFSEIKDYDFIVRGVEISALQNILAKEGRVGLVGKKFGVLKFVPKELSVGRIEALDIALPREEVSWHTGGYRDFKIDYNEHLSVQDDLGRRDFTVNAMAYEIREKKLVDLFDGDKDLREGILRTVGNPYERLSEDYSRMLRGIRFACQLNFQIEKGTWAAIEKLMVNINGLQIQSDNKKIKERIVPYEVIASELLKAFVNNPVKAFDLYDKSGAMKELMPQLLKMKKCPQPKNWHSEGDVWEHTRLCLRNLGANSFLHKFAQQIIFTKKLEIPSRVSRLRAGRNQKLDKTKLLTPELVMAVMWHDSGKPYKIQTPEKDGTDRIRFNNHDVESAKIAKANFEQLKLSASPEFNFDPERAAWLIARHHLFDAKTIKEMKNATIEKYFFSERYSGEDLLKLGFIDMFSSIQKKTGDGDLENFHKMMARIEILKKLGKGKVLPRLFINGNEVMKALKIKAGKEVGEILEKIRERQLSGKIKTKDDALKYVKSLK